MLLDIKSLIIQPFVTHCMCITLWDIFIFIYTYYKCHGILMQYKSQKQSKLHFYRVQQPRSGNKNPILYKGTDFEH